VRPAAFGIDLRSSFLAKKNIPFGAHIFGSVRHFFFDQPTHYLGHGKMMMFGRIIAFLAIGHLGPMMMMMMVASTPSHPLDSLEGEEYKAVTQILQDAGRLSNITRFAQISLVPPAKNIELDQR
jgi:hypothetical protein